MHRFKLIVRPTTASMTIVKYLVKNITEINKRGIVVDIQKLSNKDFDEETVEFFRKKGVTRLPAVFLPDSKPVVGLQAIVKLFEQCLAGKSAARTQDGDYANAEMGNNADLQDYYMQELFAGKDRKGKMIPRCDKDEAEDEFQDVERKLAAYNRNRPKHHREDARERNVDRRRRPREEPEYEDNVASDDDYEDDYEDEPPRRDTKPLTRGALSNMGEQAMDDLMLSRWMDNH